MHTGLLPHQGPLFYVQHTVFYARHAVAHHVVVVEHAAVPVLCIVRHGRIGPLPAASNAAAKTQLGQSPIERSGIVRGDEEVFLVHGFGLERPCAVPLKPELLCITKAFCISSCGIIRRTFSQVSRSLPLGVWTRYQRTRPCWLLVVAPLNAPGSFSWRRAVCSMFSPPLLDLRCTQMQGRLEQASRSQLGAVAKVQVFVSFDVAHYTSKLLTFSQITQIAARTDTSPYASTKTCTFLHNKKSRPNQRLFFYR